MIQINTNFIPKSSKTFIVGGTVRDIILGASPIDYDIVTFNNPENLAKEIAAKIRGRIVELGKPGLHIFRIVSEKRIYDVAPANGKSIEEDMLKRDFTLNAMALSVDTGKLIDPSNGIHDLKNRVIRMISPDNLRADPIRLLRAYRIGSLLNFTISRETSRAIQDLSSLICTSAGERINDELVKLFNSPRSHQYVSMMNDTGLLEAIFPELSLLKGCLQNSFHQYDAFEHTLKAYDFLEKILHTPDSLLPELADLKKILPPEKNYAMLKYAILLHDIGKPATRSIDAKGRIHFYSHEQISADIAGKINQRLRMSNRNSSYTDFIIRNHLRPLSLFIAYSENRLSRQAISRFFLKCNHMTRDLLVHTAADLFGKGINNNTRSFVKFLNQMITRYNDSYLPRKSSPPLINGADLIHEFGLKPSPLFSKILRKVEEERISANITTRHEALVFVKNFLNPE